MEMMGNGSFDLWRCRFRKNGVAIRATFKAATDGKQVAVLVPDNDFGVSTLQKFQRKIERFSGKFVFEPFRSKNKKMKPKEGLKMVKVISSSERINWWERYRFQKI